jgi:hypothetical protein
MTGIKALFLEDYCRHRGQEFVRFDYFGHGASSGDIVLGTIGQWAADAIAVIDSLTEGPQILIGSSMGRWIMLLAALARPSGSMHSSASPRRPISPRTSSGRGSTPPNGRSYPRQEPSPCPLNTTLPDTPIGSLCSKKESSILWCDRSADECVVLLVRFARSMPHLSDCAVALHSIDHPRADKVIAALRESGPG